MITKYTTAFATTATSLDDAIFLYLESLAAPAAETDSAVADLDKIASKIRKSFPELGPVRK